MTSWTSCRERRGEEGVREKRRKGGREKEREREGKRGREGKEKRKECVCVFVCIVH